MKKILMVAALIGAAFAMPTLPATAGDMAATKTGVEAKCFVFPLLPACAAEWNEEWKANGFHYTPLPVAWWTCTKAEAAAGHLLDCKTDA
ncbi:MAG: hypothetical protein ABIQ30_05275 [Devosia sp.]